MGGEIVVNHYRLSLPEDISPATRGLSGEMYDAKRGYISPPWRKR